eukprot:GHRR01030807.1.p1 GENE.GHRR01030807.1~~GHRR01030807.1.p1  ORF type:complete len:132 (+),score=37.91 GHRR01030807.1:315-710(+)
MVLVLVMPQQLLMGRFLGVHRYCMCCCPCCTLVVIQQHSALTNLATAMIDTRDKQLKKLMIENTPLVPSERTLRPGSGGLPQANWLFKNAGSRLFGSLTRLIGFALLLALLLLLLLLLMFVPGARGVSRKL